MRFAPGEQHRYTRFEKSFPERTISCEDPRVQLPAQLYQSVVSLVISGHLFESPSEFSGRPGIDVPPARDAVKLSENGGRHCDVGSIDLPVDFLFQTEADRERQQEGVRVD